MSKFTKNFTVIKEFDGDTITVNMSRMKRKDAMKLAPFMNKAADSDVATMTFEDNMQMVDAAADLLPKYINSITGLVIDGVEVTKDSELFKTMLEEIYFLELVSELISELVQNSFLQNVKKSEALPENTLVGSQITVENS